MQRLEMNTTRFMLLRRMQQPTVSRYSKTGSNCAVANI